MKQERFFGKQKRGKDFSILEQNAKTGLVVNSFNEWDLLEEVIVGVVDGAIVPEWHITLQATMPAHQRCFYQKYGGMPFPIEQVEAAKRELEEFVHILEVEGVTVRRPDSFNHSQPYEVPGWKCQGGLYAAMPRDSMLVIGNEIIETPMSWRSRYFETFPFRSLLKEYFQKGAKWTAAPKPQLTDELYNYDYNDDAQEMSYVITEFEPTFDAADFIRCGKDIFAQKSHVTNSFGIEWLRRHLGNTFQIHIIEVYDRHSMHIDATLLPLAPGKLLVNSERLISIPNMFRSWDIITAPPPCIPDDHPLYMTSKWVNMNLLMLDEQRVIVEKQEEPMMKMLRAYGFHVIPCNFRHFNSFGGSFHCATLDIRRRGTLESYF